MPEERFDERTEPATPRRRQEARERGHVVRSVDLSSAVILLGAVLGLRFFGDDFGEGLMAAMKNVFERLSEMDGTRESLAPNFAAALMAAGVGMLPFLAMVSAAALAVGFFQVGFLFTTESMEPSLERIDPIAGFQRLFSLRAVVRLAAGVLKVVIVSVIVGVSLWWERSSLVGLVDRSFEEIVKFMLYLLFTVSFRVVLAILVLAILEYGYQRWQYEKDLRMSRSEIREELKRFEGDPKIRERRRSVQRHLALQRMMQRVPKATVVVTNPTHVAVALEYDRDKMEAPIVAAKGAELLAQRIREIAFEHRVPIVERPELARMLYKNVEVGRPVPVDLYQAVAEIMAYVYRLQGAMA